MPKDPPVNAGDPDPGREPWIRVSGAATKNRANPNPVGPASYVTATGPGNDRTHDNTTMRRRQPPLEQLPGLTV